MSSYAYFLLLVLENDQIMRVAVAVHKDNLMGTDVEEYPMEHENRAFLQRFLPWDLQENQILEVDRLADVQVTGPKED